MTADDIILIDKRTGRVTGGSAVERAGLAAMRTASATMRLLKLPGFSRAVRLIGAVFPGASVVRFVLADDVTFEMPYADPYWSMIVRRGASYDEDVRAMLRSLSDIDYAFVDCGANYGYWSVLVSSSAYGSRPAVAVEAAPDTFAWLVRNAEANDSRFAILNRAVAEQSGDTVNIYGARHESRSMLSDGGEGAVGRVQTLALDDLLERPEFAAQRPILLKLDVEGAEVAALNGASRMLERDVLILYEDHGADREHVVSAHIVGKLGMRLFAAENAGLRHLQHLDELDKIKRNRRWGYDFFATSSPFWLEHMETLVEASRARRNAAGTRI